MKDFIKWLGVNEKVAKVAVWMLIFMVTLIIFNAAFESLGFPNYQITYDNLKEIDTNIMLENIVSWIIIVLNFYSLALLVFRVKEAKSIFKYSILYLFLNIIITKMSNDIIVQAFIITFLILFSYLYSNKNKKYILYAIISIVINVIVQGIWFAVKAKFVDFSTVNNITQAVLTIDYFIIMAVIILVKEIYVKKRGEKKCGMDTVYYGLVNSTKKTKSPKKQLKN